MWQNSVASNTNPQAGGAGGDVPEPSSVPREDGEVGRGHQWLWSQHQEQQQVRFLSDENIDLFN